MSKYKVGDKFIIEISEKYTNDADDFVIEDETLYRVKGFKSLVFDNNGLDKLQKYGTVIPSEWYEKLSEQYNKGLDNAWELARKIYHNTTSEDIKKIFGVNCFANFLKDLSPQEALAKIEAYEKSKQIQVGDVVYANGVQGVVIDIISDDDCYIYDENGCIEVVKFEKINKTGRTVDIEHILEQIRRNE